MQRSQSTYSNTLDASEISYEFALEKYNVCFKLHSIYIYILILFFFST